MIKQELSSGLLECVLEAEDFPAPNLLHGIPSETLPFYIGSSLNPYLATLFNVALKFGDDEILTRQFTHVEDLPSRVAFGCEVTASRMTMDDSNLYRQAGYGLHLNFAKVINNVVNPASPHAASRHLGSEDDQMDVALLLFAVWVADSDRANLSDLQLVKQYAGIASNPSEPTVEWVEHAAALSRFGRVLRRRSYMDSDTRTFMQELYPVSTYALTTIREQLKVESTSMVYEDILRLVELTGGWDELADLSLTVPAHTLLALA